VVSSRDELTDRYDDLTEQYPDDAEVPVPDFWGGYRLTPDEIEFWQGRPNRLHDRIRYRSTRDGWEIDRLSP
jgi:pyridoxamine 5'-phosphate oxidase